MSSLPGDNQEKARQFLNRTLADINVREGDSGRRTLFTSLAEQGIDGVKAINLVKLAFENDVDPARIDWKSIIDQKLTYSELKTKVLREIQGEVGRAQTEAQQRALEQDNKALKNYMNTLRKRAESGGEESGEALQEYNELARDIPDMEPLTVVTSDQYDDLVEAQDRLMELQRRNEEQQDRINELEQRVEELQQETGNQERIRELEQEIERQEQQLEERDQFINDLQQQLEEAQQEQQPVDSDDVDDVVRRLAENIEEQQESINQLTQNMGQLVQAMQNLPESLEGAGQGRPPQQTRVPTGSLRTIGVWAFDIERIPQVLSEDRATKILQGFSPVIEDEGQQTFSLNDTTVNTLSDEDLAIRYTKNKIDRVREVARQWAVERDTTTVTANRKQNSEFVEDTVYRVEDGRLIFRRGRERNIVSLSDDDEDEQ